MIDLFKMVIFQNCVQQPEAKFGLRSAFQGRFVGQSMDQRMAWDYPASFDDTHRFPESLESLGPTKLPR